MTVERLKKAKRFDEAINLLDHIQAELKEEDSLAAFSMMDTFRDMSTSYVGITLSTNMWRGCAVLAVPQISPPLCCLSLNY